MATRAFYRIVSRSRSASAALLSAAGRFNSMESPSTCYVAEELGTAWAEVASRFGELPADPTAFAAFRVDVDDLKLFDLVDHGSRTELLVDPAPAAARVFADDLRRTTDYEGIRYPSMRRPGHYCIVLLLEKLGKRITASPMERDHLREAVSDV